MTYLTQCYHPKYSCSWWHKLF